MKIVTIFAEKLYACHYADKAYNEYARLMDLWTDVSYLRQYALQNNIADIRNFIADIRKSAEFIEDLMEKMSSGRNSLDLFFKPLNNLETGVKVLSLRKGRQYKLRLYAIKIVDNLYLITGGAIKLVFKMADHPDTQREKVKLDQAKAYLISQGVFDDDSFYELIYDDYEDE